MLGLDAVYDLLRAYAVESAMEMGVRLLPFDLVVVDEVCMLPGWLFDALFAAWHSIDRLPVLLLAGDEGQLAPFTDDGSVEASNSGSYYWNWVDQVRLTECAIEHMNFMVTDGVAREFLHPTLGNKWNALWRKHQLETSARQLNSQELAGAEGRPIQQQVRAALSNQQRGEEACESAAHGIERCGSQRGLCVKLEDPEGCCTEIREVLY